jgi:hypothetical protein
MWKDDPLAIHSQAEDAAQLARFARDKQGDAGFWAAHDALLDRSVRPTPEKLIEIAKKLGLDPMETAKVIDKRRYLSASERAARRRVISKRAQANGGEHGVPREQVLRASDRTVKGPSPGSFVLDPHATSAHAHQRPRVRAQVYAGTRPANIGKCFTFCVLSSAPSSRAEAAIK